MNFRRAVGEVVHLLALTWDKKGRPRFSVMFSSAGANGVTYHGQHVPAGELLIEHSATLGFLVPSKPVFAAGWFRRDRNFIQTLLDPGFRGDESLVQQFVALLPEIEQYWATGAVSRHLRFAPQPRPWVVSAANAA
jgi:hypothetical protein